MDGTSPEIVGIIHLHFIDHVKIEVIACSRDDLNGENLVLISLPKSIDCDEWMFC